MSRINLSCIVVITEQTFMLKVSKKIKLSELIKQCKLKINEKISFKICLDEEYLVEEHLNLQDDQVLYIILDELPIKNPETDSNTGLINTGTDFSNQPIPSDDRSTQRSSHQKNPNFNPQQFGNLHHYGTIMKDILEDQQIAKSINDQLMKYINENPQGFANFLEMWGNLFFRGSNNSSFNSNGEIGLDFNYFNKK